MDYGSSFKKGNWIGLMMYLVPRRRRIFPGLRLMAAMLALVTAPAAAQSTWLTIENDGLRDPASPAVKILQQPADALSALPPDSAGNRVRWVKALDEGFINPRTNIKSGTKVQTYDKDVLLDLNGSMPVVRFPHRVHTLWLDCSNCHDHLFKMQRGATKISMFNILQGEQCGLCHGAVAFPLTECSRCHSTSHKDAKAELAREAAQALPAQDGPK
jgi:c(7)-type cytochrome triheme protein